MTSPVTQTAEVDVNKASIGEAAVRVRVAIGSINKRLPSKITIVKPNRITRNGDICLLCVSCCICRLLIYLYFFFILNIIHIQSKEKINILQGVLRWR